METKTNFRNDLFKRQELIFELESEKTPSFAEAKKLISENFKKPEEAIDVYKSEGKFGRKVFIIGAYVYDSKEDLIKAIQKTKKQRVAEKKAEAEAKNAEVEAKKAAEESSKTE